MSNKLTIVVQNQSEEEKQFMIFREKPVFSEQVGEVYTNVWATSPGRVSKDGISWFEIPEKLYAICGMQPGNLQSGASVFTSDYQNVKVSTSEEKGTNCSLEIGDGAITFNRKDQSTIEGSYGGFGVRTSGSDRDMCRYAICGVGMMSSDSGTVIPTSTWRPAPNMAYQIYPRKVYYVSTAGREHKPGSIVNVSDLKNVCTIDFTGRKETTAKVTLNQNSEYGTVHYS